MICCILNTVTPLLYTLGRLGLEEKTDHLMSLNIMSGTTKRSRLTVFAAALFHWCLYNHQCVLFPDPVLPKHIPTCSVRQFFTHCADIRGVPKKVYRLFNVSVCISLGFMIGQVQLTLLSSWNVLIHLWKVSLCLCE